MFTSLATFPLISNAAEKPEVGIQLLTNELIMEANIDTDQLTSWLKQAIAKAEHLLIVGFSMAECDRDEFRRAISFANDLKKITVANPTLRDGLVDELRGRVPEFVHWPQGPDGPEVRL